MTERCWTKHGSILKTGVYVLVLSFLVLFLYRMGAEPWREVAGRGVLVFILIVITATGLVIQAQSYRKVAPHGCMVPSLGSMVYIWAISAAVSVVAPLVAAIATRTALVVRAGMPIPASLQASVRQTWIGVEMALLLGGLVLPEIELPYVVPGSIALLLGWLLMVLTRWSAARLVQSDSGSGSRIRNWIAPMIAPVRPSVYPWFAMQIILMSATYLIAFNGLGAELEVTEAVALSSLTVVMSVLVFVPNGLGFTDAVWVLVATKSGLTMEKAVALAIIFRISHLMAAILLSAVMRLIALARARCGGKGSEVDVGSLFIGSRE